MRRTALLLALLAGCARIAAAQTPLDRVITVRVRDVSLQDALDRIALLANVRLSYSGDNLPLDRRVSVTRDSSTLGDVLLDLLRPYPVQPVAVASDHVVLAPRQSKATDSVSTIAVLDRVVVTGSVLGASERPLPIALDVIRGRDAERRDEGKLSQVLSGAVPGMWMWEQTPSSMLARYGSIRGSSSFGLTFPKVYIDGIEVANPLLLTQITPEIVERVEVIRGPQGAALYGADAISGVVNIISRHDGTRADGSHVLVRSSGGFTSAYTSSSVPTQEHALMVRGGSNFRSAGITVSGATSGEYIPQAYSREFRSVADARLIGDRTTMTASARYYAKNAGVPANPLLANYATDDILADADPQTLRMYSLGSTITYAPAEPLTYAVTFGVDGYRLANVSNDLSPIPSVADTALRDARESALRGTMRVSAVRRAGTPERVGATFTVAAEQSMLRSRTQGEVTLPTGGPGPGGAAAVEVAGVSNNSGVSGQINIAVRNTLFATAGLREERIDETDGPSQGASLPMIGGALVRELGFATLKLRAAYGRGIRAPRTTIHSGARESKRTLLNPDLAPEEQAGTEAGFDVILAGKVGLHLTRFDQLATGLIQNVTISDPTDNSGPGSGVRHETWYQLQNVGEISNSGWEAQASVALGAFSFGGAATLVDSRVRKVSSSYGGDLRAGDRMLAVPARTLSGSASWVGQRIELSSTLSRASDWINYDRLAIAKALIDSGGDARAFTGAKLRRFWASYPGATRLRASALFDVYRGIGLILTGENLLNYQRGEPDSITIVPGRTITVGIKARF